MQKSRKLMVSLCGLALSSLFVVNSKSVVHADAVNDANNQNNNAISWDSDSDQAQQVQNNSQTQPVQNTQVADDNQQNQVSNVQSYAETSNVDSSLVIRPLTNQTKSVQISNGNDAQNTSPVVINNPANDIVNVHYVDRNGNAINDANVKNTIIDLTKTGQGSYSVPNGYSVNNPDGKYTISGGAFNVTNLKASTDYHSETYRTVYKTETWYGSAMRGGTTVPKTATYKDVQEINDNDDKYGLRLIHIFPTKQQADSWNSGYDYSSGPNDRTYYDVSPVTVTNVPETAVETPAYTSQTLPVAFVDSNNNLVGMIQNYTGKVGTTQNVALTVPTGYKLADGATLPTSVTFQNSDKAQLIKVVPNGEKNSVQANKVHVKFVDQSTGQEVAGGYDITLSDTDTKSGVYNIPAGYGALHNTYGVNAVIGGVVFNQPGDPNGQPVFYINDTDATKSSIAKKLINYYYNYWLKSDPSWANDMFFIHKNATGNEVEYPDYSGYLSLKDGTWDKHDVGFTSRELNYLNDVATPNVNRKGISVHYTYGKPRFEDDYNMITQATGNDPVIVTVPIHQSKTFMFADNSGNAVSAKGNIVDVALTKKDDLNPSKVNPDSPEWRLTHSSATRTIQLNFPGGTVPVSYKNIVNDRGVLTQTVNFTRDVQVDSLLDPSDSNYVLSEGAWKSDNKDPNFIGFPERTLPKIPGYTLRIAPLIQA